MNSGRGEAESFDITDTLPPNLTMWTGSYDAPGEDCGGTGTGGSGSPIAFDPGDNDGGTNGVAPLTFTFDGLASTTDSIAFFDSNGAEITDANEGFDTRVRSFVVSPSGVMLGQSQDPNGAGQYSFTISYLVRLE